MTAADADGLGSRVGIGRTAEVHAWDSGRIIKLIRPGFPDGLGDREAGIARRVTAAGLAAPRFLGTERVVGRFGLVYERVDGPSMLDRLTGRPWLVDRLATAFAELHVQMHGADGTGLPDQRATFRAAIDRGSDAIGAARADAALLRVDDLPAGSAVCHGDFHPGNVILAGAGPVAIDWLTASSGRPEADIARTLFLLTKSALPGVYPQLQRALIAALRRRFATIYLRAYRRLRTIDEEQLALWRLPVLAARVAEAVDDEEHDLLAAIDAELGR
jgi:aminoglycoside phosphotransferase (APT) family kinase protein